MRIHFDDNYTDSAMNVNRFGESACELPTVVLRGQSRTAANRVGGSVNRT